MKANLNISVEVDYPCIEDAAKRHSVEIGETRTAMDIVMDTLRKAFFLDKSEKFKTIGAAKVEYSFKVDLSGEAHGPSK